MILNSLHIPECVTTLPLRKTTKRVVFSLPLIPDPLKDGPCFISRVMRGINVNPKPL